MTKGPLRLKGVGASPGIALGYVHFLDRSKVSIPKRTITRAEAPTEVARFDEALEVARTQLRQLRKKINEEQGDEHIYLIEAQQLMLDDKSLTEDTRELIQSQLVNAEWALQRAMDRFKSMFDKIDDEYFRDRRSDIEYVEERLLRALAGSREREYVSLQQKTILISHDLAPADIAKLHREHLAAFATDIGGRTSHTTIIARSLAIPVVVGLGDISQHAQNGDRAIVDGSEGIVILKPDPTTWTEYEKKRSHHLQSRKELLKNRNFKAETKDQYEIHLKANIDFSEEISFILENGAEGIGMLRTEHLFLGGSIPVSEDEQFQIYKKIVSKLKPQPVVIRMLDLAGDELFSPPSTMQTAPSPALGLRGMRLLLAERELLRTQFRAILRASAFGSVSILYPMVTVVEEVREANSYLRQMMDDLKKENVSFDPDISIGALIEVPAAAIVADQFAQEVDFLSVGSNDLTQYTLASDRSNPLVANLYDPIHPAMLILLKRIVEMGHKAGIEVGICGEMGSEPVWIPLLVGLEFNFISMTPGSIPLIKQIIRKLSMDECKDWVKRALEAPSYSVFKGQLTAWCRERFPDISA